MSVIKRGREFLLWSAMKLRLRNTPFSAGLFSLSRVLRYSSYSVSAICLAVKSIQRYLHGETENGAEWHPRRHNRFLLQL